ncbi:hypothetical protein BCR33DRAFT_491611 [Rhizoclosmatium globosum]|uniref:Uncharacterized protein n=1 Tax=Rhizoclosmatium globosum TaxID=329046 RepID=A0A1Y2BMM6_9FUNG|nr:hypothetical protein BCR33DRAFT_491611 [Rhizoclosmatium globosum]|eukprot:ORY36008.1 hypothetical protein BCR33DRAFT_491611 [Rhizoclosmatium globosum]
METSATYNTGIQRMDTFASYNVVARRPTGFLSEVPVKNNGIFDLYGPAITTTPTILHDSEFEQAPPVYSEVPVPTEALPRTPSEIYKLGTGTTPTKEDNLPSRTNSGRLPRGPPSNVSAPRHESTPSSPDKKSPNHDSSSQPNVFSAINSAAAQTTTVYDMDTKKPTANQRTSLTLLFLHNTSTATSTTPSDPITRNLESAIKSAIIDRVGTSLPVWTHKTSVDSSVPDMSRIDWIILVLSKNSDASERKGLERWREVAGSKLVPVMYDVMTIGEIETREDVGGVPVVLVSEEDYSICVTRGNQETVEGLTGRLLL